MARLTRAVHSAALMITFFVLGMIFWHWILHSDQQGPTTLTARHVLTPLDLTHSTTATLVSSFGTANSSFQSETGIASSNLEVGTTSSSASSADGSWFDYDLVSPLEDVNLDTPKRAPSPDDDSSSSSSSESCTITVTAIYQSVFCTSTTTVGTITASDEDISPTGTSAGTTITTIITDTTTDTTTTTDAPLIFRRDTNCSTLAYSTVISCSATAANVTLSATATATEYIDFCQWGNCGLPTCTPDEPAPTPVPDQLTPNLTVEARGEYWRAPQRHYPPEPSNMAGNWNYGLDKSAFIRGEVALAFSQGFGVDITQADVTTSFGYKWGGHPVSVSLEALYGCTAVIVVSKRGVLAFHIWEVPTFKPKGKQAPPDPNVFQKNVYDVLSYKDPAVSGQVAGILNMRSDSPAFKPIITGWDTIFNNDATPEIFVMHPIWKMDKDLLKIRPEDDARWPVVESDIVPFLQNMFGEGATPYNLPITTWRYSPSYKGSDRRYEVVSGKALIQYAPAGNAKSLVNYKVWIEEYKTGENKWSPLDSSQVYPQGQPTSE